MKTLLVPVFVLLAALPRSSAQGLISSPADMLPNCASACLFKVIGDSACSLKNRTCLCADLPFKANMSACVESSCSVKEALATMNMTDIACGAPIRDKGAELNAIAITLGSISPIVVIIRLFSRYVLGTGFWFDDYFIALALLAGLPYTVLIPIGLTSNGLGKDIWKVSFEQITNFLRIFYLMELTYFYEIPLLKISILFFYLRIFPLPLIRGFIWATIVITALYGIVFIFVGIFQCQPINYYWNQWDGRHEGRCINVNGLGWSSAAISIVIDVWMLGIAISQIMHFNLHWKKKVAVGLMLFVGTFVTVVSVFRLQYIVHFANSTNPTWDNVAVLLWSSVEINVGFICACMPSMRAFLRWLTSKPNKMECPYKISHSGTQSQRRLISSSPTDEALGLESAQQAQHPVPPEPLRVARGGPRRYTSSAFSEF